MSEDRKRYTGGCLCGAVRYEAEGEPKFAGHCYCADCRKASGSGFAPFMGFPSDAVRFTGQTLKFASKAASGDDAVRNSCPVCGSLVFGGEIGNAKIFTVYAERWMMPHFFIQQWRSSRTIGQSGPRYHPTSRSMSEGFELQAPFAAGVQWKCACRFSVMDSIRGIAHLQAGF